MADPFRPWELWEHNGLYSLSRARRGDSSTVEPFRDDRRETLLLNRADAEALQAALSAHVSRRATARPGLDAKA